ncbi:MAG: BMP family ABC transporter substrate-binding protein [Eubacteriales bacterium]|nr:BMP family ABC transporter substrate-binding protein [Eubacterium sp.]MDY5492944.1 BMP family ABC transporter substrate-binding protein [Eubacteriales bacterium]
MLKKVLSMVLAFAMLAVACVLFASCGNKTSDFKIGVICLHDETSTYDLNFINAIEGAQKALGLSDDQVIIIKNVPEGNECLDAAKDLVDQGCKVIFADSFGHESFMIQAAKTYPEVMFCHATGTKAHTEKLPNYFNAFASIYEGRYLAGVAAGLKLNELKEAGKLKGDAPKMGYVGAFPYAEVISGYTAFYLGAKSVCPNVVMDVTFTGQWYDVTAEQQAAEKLINVQKCDLISQHADSMGAPGACESAGVPNVSYNGSTETACPNTFIISSRIDWQPYFELIIKAVKDNDGKIPVDYTGTLSTGSVALTAIGKKAPAAGTQAKLDEVKAKLESGEIKVFDTNAFTVGGEKITTFMADVDDLGDYQGDTEAVKDGYFHESEYRSAPYFTLEIDGITLLDRGPKTEN